MNWDETELKGQIGSGKFEFKSPLIIYFGNHFIFGIETYLRRWIPCIKKILSYIFLIFCAGLPVNNAIWGGHPGMGFYNAMF